MRTLTATLAAGVFLVAGQAWAVDTISSGARIGDRVGSRAESSSELSGIPLPVLLVGAAVLVATVVVATDDDSESD